MHQRDGPGRPVRSSGCTSRRRNGKRRPLGIPVILDRAQQARVKNALEPEWEARFEPRSYGFRPGPRLPRRDRGHLQDAARQTAPTVWILDADLAAAFDRIDHDHLLRSLGSFPARGLIRDWLKAGVIETGKGSHRPRRASPQGGVISPVLMNVALHGLEAGRRGPLPQHSGSRRRGRSTGRPVLVQIRRRYARVVPHPRAGRAGQGTACDVAGAPGLGLQRGQDTHRPRQARVSTSWVSISAATPTAKLLIKPSKAAVRRIRKRLAAEVRSLQGDNAVGGDRSASTRSSGAGPPITGARCPVRCSTRWTPTCGTSPTGGPYAGTEQVEAVDRRPLLRRIPSGQERSVGVRRPRQRRLPDQVLLDADRSAPVSQGRGLTLRSRVSRLLGTGGEARARLRWVGPHCDCFRRRKAAAHSAEITSYTPTTSQHPPPNGSNG